jgi:hypothetical protein
VVWPEVAEISLCGALGCGGALVAAAIEHLKHASHPRPVHPKKSEEGGVATKDEKEKMKKGKAKKGSLSGSSRSNNKSADNESSRSSSGGSRPKKEVLKRSSRGQKHNESEEEGDGEEVISAGEGDNGDEKDGDDDEDEYEEEVELAEDDEDESSRISLTWGGYKAIVLQATEAAVPFYERFGFMRLGAVSRWHDRLDMPEVRGKGLGLEVVVVELVYVQGARVWKELSLSSDIVETFQAQQLTTLESCSLNLLFSLLLDL